MKQRSRQFQQSAQHTHFKLHGDLGAFEAKWQRKKTKTNNQAAGVNDTKNNNNNYRQGSKQSLC